MTMTSTERVRIWRKENPEKARAIVARQYEREADKIRKRASQWSRDNPERRKEIKRAYDDRRRQDHKTWARHMASAIKCRCKKRGIPFDLTADDLLGELPDDLMCPALGIPIVFGSKLSPNSPSIDRVIPQRGYVRGNVRVISNRANVMKQDSTDPEEMRRIARYMEENILRCGQATLAEGAVS